MKKVGITTDKVGELKTVVSKASGKPKKNARFKKKGTMKSDKITEKSLVAFVGKVNPYDFLPETWDYDKSVAKCKNIFKVVKEQGETYVIELLHAHEMLAVQKRVEGKTWGGFCKEIGITTRTAINWFDRYNLEWTQISGPKAKPKTAKPKVLGSDSAKDIIIDVEAIVEDSIDESTIENIPKGIKKQEYIEVVRLKNLLERTSDALRHCCIGFDAIAMIQGKKRRYKTVLKTIIEDNRTDELIQELSDNIIAIDDDYIRIDDYLRKLSIPLASVSVGAGLNNLRSNKINFEGRNKIKIKVRRLVEEIWKAVGWKFDAIKIVGDDIILRREPKSEKEPAKKLNIKKLEGKK